VAVVGAGSLQIALGAPAAAFTVANIGFNLLMTNIPSLDMAGTAACVACSLAQEGSSQYVEKNIQAAVSRIENTQKLIKAAEEDIARLSNQLGNRMLKEFSGPMQQAGYTQRGVSHFAVREADPVLKSYTASKQATINYYKQQLQAQKSSLGVWKGVSYTLPVIFFAYDVWQALRTFRQDLKAAAN
ncbi:MAG: hypothetical protein ACPL88_06535, partial [Bryobacteraceae bacterium]